MCSGFWVGVGAEDFYASHYGAELDSLCAGSGPWGPTGPWRGIKRGWKGLQKGHNSCYSSAHRFPWNSSSLLIVIIFIFFQNTEWCLLNFIKPDFVHDFKITRCLYTVVFFAYLSWVFWIMKGHFSILDWKRWNSDSKCVLKTEKVLVHKTISKVNNQ